MPRFDAEPDQLAYEPSVRRDVCRAEIRPLAKRPRLPASCVYPVATPFVSGEKGQHWVRHRDLGVAAILASLLYLTFFFCDFSQHRSMCQQKAIAAGAAPVVELLMPPTVEAETMLPDEIASETVAAVDPPRLDLNERPPTVPIEPEQFIIEIAPGTGLADRQALGFPSGRIGGGSVTQGNIIFSLSDLDQAPEIRTQPLPQYPPELQRAGITGEVVVSFVVDVRGDVGQARVVQSSRPEFDAAALQAVSRWRFRPGKKFGHAVATRMEAPIVFTLPGKNLSDRGSRNKRGFRPVNIRNLVVG